MRSIRIYGRVLRYRCQRWSPFGAHRRAWLPARPLAPQAYIHRRLPHVARSVYGRVKPLRCPLWVGTSSSSCREAVAGATRTALRKSYGRSTAYSGHSSHRRLPGRTAAWCQSAWVRSAAASVSTRCAAEIGEAISTVSNGSWAPVQNRREQTLGRAG